ncbi:hypothetical protein ACFWBF_34710, partial [Streptomyces sp. NPDC060028]|uniref:hypothetical protein n=1 Tax=Streptomyces sp. NPDC060028 TaxID=3347041 RepID=UPI0036D13A1D
VGGRAGQGLGGRQHHLAAGSRPVASPGMRASPVWWTRACGRPYGVGRSGIRNQSGPKDRPWLGFA